MRFLGALALALMMATACVSEQPQGAPSGIVTDLPANAAQSYQYTLTSQHTVREYVIRISAPIDPLPRGKKAPVVYVTDGNWYFGMATDIVRLRQMSRMTGPAYIVAIGYPDQKVENVIAKREIDLVHNKARGPHGMMGGGGDSFLAFLTDELRPFIEARLRVDPERSVLAGQSLGGLFAANVLLHQPESFSGYLIGSPSLWADASVLKAAQTFKAGKGQRVFVGVGGAEGPQMLEGAEALGKALSASSTGLAVEQDEFADLTHTSMLGAWFGKGLYYLLSREPAAT